MSRLSLALVMALFATACAGPPGDERGRILAPSFASFNPIVFNVLAAHCGTLDCHGDSRRNFMIFGMNGMRLDAERHADAGDPDTTQAEYEATYQSLVWLEPERITQVTREHGSEPQRLTLVRKARGSEQHKGGAQLPPGSAGDRCLTTWLAGAPDDTACAAATPEQ